MSSTDNPQPPRVPEATTGPAALSSDLKDEYYKILDLVTGFDQRILTVKSWGVTLSLFSLGVGFQQDHYGMFLIAAVSALAFWIVESVTKTHQMRYYPRMRDIEVASYVNRRALPDGRTISTPLIDWSWKKAAGRRVGRSDAVDVPQRHEDDPIAGSRRAFHAVFLQPHIAFPHAITLVTGGVLFWVGAAGHLGKI